MHPLYDPTAEDADPGPADEAAGLPPPPAPDLGAFVRAWHTARGTGYWPSRALVLLASEYGLITVPWRSVRAAGRELNRLLWACQRRCTEFPGADGFPLVLEHATDARGWRVRPAVLHWQEREPLTTIVPEDLPRPVTPVRLGEARREPTPEELAQRRANLARAAADAFLKRMGDE